MKRSAVWQWRSVWLFAMVAIAGFLALQFIFGGYWQILADIALYVMFYAMGRQHQTEAFGIRMIQFIKNHHDGNEKEPWT